jgi:DMSO reductase anchor subunit
LAAVLSAVALAVGLAGGGLHLGRPLKAWRAFLGVRRSWLSREIAVFGLLTPLAAATAWMCWRHPTAPGLLALQGACGLLSVAGVYCSGMIYHATGRACWIGRRSVGRFFATTLALGLAFAWMIGALAGESSSVPAVVLMAVTLARGCWERAGLVGRGDGARITALRSDTVRARAGFLLRFRLAAWRRGRWACAWIGGAALPGLTLLSSPTGSDAVWAAIGFLLCLAGEGIERSLFFRTAVAPKMPGGVAA